jgi:O-Antigen ligase
MTFGERVAQVGPVWTRTGIVIAGGLTVVALAVATAVRPTYGIVAAVAVLGVLFLLLVGRRLPRLFLGALAIILVLYAFFGRGIAYLGVSPIYMGEMVLILGLLALLVSIRRLQLTPIHVLLLAFMAWGAIRTVPYIPQDGIDALRDAVLWGYAAFAFAVSACLLPSDFRRLTRIFARVLPIFVLWVPIAAVISLRFENILPTLPGAPVGILDFKGGDMAVHLAGVAAFLLVGLYGTAIGRRVSDLLLWLGWLVGIAAAAAINRGGMLAAGAGGLVATLLQPTFQRLVKPVAVTIGVVLVLLIANPQIEMAKGRYLSISQFVANFTSVVDTSSVSSSLQGTIAWRQAWWNTIIDYTFHGPYFWTGKGYGINLATADGFQVDPVGQSLRAPHNGHLDVLARSGVIGFGLWIAFLLTFALSMARTAILARRRGDIFWAQIITWILAYWTASTVNATFDVYLEGPQGGIWFWALTGIGLVAMRAAGVREGDPDRARTDGSMEPAAARVATDPLHATVGHNRYQQAGAGPLSLSARARLAARAIWSGSSGQGNPPVRSATVAVVLAFNRARRAWQRGVAGLIGLTSFSRDRPALGRPPPIRSHAKPNFAHTD